MIDPELRIWLKDNIATAIVDRVDPALPPAAQAEARGRVDAYLNVLDHLAELDRDEFNQKGNYPP